MGKCKCDCGPDKECRKTFLCILKNVRYWALNSTQTTTQGGSGTNNVLTNATITSFPVQQVVIEPGTEIHVVFGALPNGNVIGGYFVASNGNKVPFGVLGLNPHVTPNNYAGLTYYPTIDGLQVASSTRLGVSFTPPSPSPIEFVRIAYTFTEIAFITTT